MADLNPNIISNPLEGAIATQFGVPTCMLGMGKALLSLLPGDILGGMYGSMGDGMLKARSVLAKVNNSIFRDLGILSYDAATGTFSFLSDDSKWGIDGYGSSVFDAIGQILGAGAAIWETVEATTDAIDKVKACLQEYKDLQEGMQSKTKIQSASELASSPAKFAVYQYQYNTAMSFIASGTTFQKEVEQIFQERIADPALVPNFIDAEEPPIFRLTFGPPKAKSGQFILSVDGLYYDSQSRVYGASGSPSDVPTLSDLSALEFIPDSSRWLLDHSPNLGGRGTSYSLHDLGEYVNTLFDINLIDDSKTLQEWYEADHMVQFLISQKNKRIEYIKDNLVDLRASGYTTDSAIYINFSQQIITENAAFNNKINKRKKQIEVAVKAPDLFGASGLIPVKGTIPINDFSYLSSINLDVAISRQKGLSFDHGEVSGIILPITPNYVHADESRQKVVVTPLLVNGPGAGSIIDGEELEGNAPMMSLVTGIAVADLIAVYNFTDIGFGKPNTAQFKVLNCNSTGMENRAQMVSTRPSLLFNKGLGLPYLTGIPVREKLDSFTDFTGETWNTHQFNIVEAGNYVRLPDTQKYQNLLYGTKGATIDFWTHIPGLYEQESGWWEHPTSTSSFGFTLSSSEGKWCDGHYYRVLLGCENTGGQNTTVDPSAVVVDKSSDSVRGMLMGFSRDPKMYYDGSSVVTGPNDFDPRYNFGGIIDSVSGQIDHPYGKGVSGTWATSSNVDEALPIAAKQASGEFSVHSETSAITFTLGKGQDGDGLTASSNNQTYWIYTTSGSNPQGMSATMGISYYDTGDDKTLNIGTPSTCFFIAPTRSYNTSSVGFTRGAGCARGAESILKFTVSDRLLAKNVNLMDCTSKFVNITVVFDVQGDKIKFYLNGNLLKTGSLSDTFGTTAFTAPQVPSFKVPNSESTSSFEYASGTVTQGTNVTLFDDGPKNDKYFTPWIVGGGWSDGRDINLDTSSGGFLDLGAGIMSSYNGYVGSLKIYEKALDTKEIGRNYNHQKTFFENIEI